MKKSVEIRNVTKICFATDRRERRTDGRERSNETEQGLEARLHKYGRGENILRSTSRCLRGKINLWYIM